MGVLAVIMLTDPLYNIIHIIYYLIQFQPAVNYIDVMIAYKYAVIVLMIINILKLLDFSSFDTIITILPQ